MPTPTMNSIVSALRFFFTHTIDRPDLARKVIRVAHPRTLPVILSRDEVARLLNATTGGNCLMTPHRQRRRLAQRLRPPKVMQRGTV
jgi:hypothetical protein